MDVDVIDRSQCLINKKALGNIEEDARIHFLSVTPPNLTFTFNCGNLKVQKKTIEITNYFPKSCPIQPLPLETHYFRMQTITQGRWLTPGSIFKLNILFIPDEARDYNDVLNIRYFNNRLLEIKITAKATTDFSFPTNVNFGVVPLGRPVCYKMPIYSHSKKQFSFAILPCKEDPCVDIYPRWGHVKPGQEPLIIMVIYRPLRYISLNFQIRIFITDLCKIPYVINFYAYTRPGVLRETLENVEPEMKSKARPIQRKVSAIARKKMKPISLDQPTLKSCAIKPDMELSSFDESLLKECGYLPLYTQHAVNCIMNSKSRKPFGEHDLRGPSSLHMFQILEEKVRKLKEFLTKVENYRQENELAKIHHKSKVNYGTRDISENQIIEIKIQREQEWNDYEDSMKTSLDEDLFGRQKAKKIRQRILRSFQKSPNEISMSSKDGQSFLRYCNNMLFLQAARKIVIKNRLLKVLAKLKQLTFESVVKLEESFINY
ncbi:cilia- and flagella-associated protein 221-like [Colletes gigas]|uniref:cilia- and flagella-associated protein 221-like n=1 Tax=Colletes gigas TaxID=935657 RepID=UPI001C9B774C|nr:cilia- and flagella-associated protein 221-like [Colletes gigas]